jgi:hypothetical protein
MVVVVIVVLAPMLGKINTVRYEVQGSELSSSALGERGDTVVEDNFMPIA